MKKLMKIEGIHCGGCEGRLKRAMEALPQVEEADANHVDGTCIVTLKEAVADDVLKQTAEAANFKVLGIE